MADNKFILKFSGDTTQLQNAVQQANSTLTGFVNKVRGFGGMIAAGFAVSQIGEFVLDVSRLAGEAEGVRAAFEKLPNSIKLMADLKDATKGTVSELELMKRAVMASNFDISLKALPQLLEFATVRAKQTGQSVDYLVDSIVTGIGRKSKLILDNLGISAVALGEALGGVSMEAASVGDVAEAVGKIASDSLKTMGEMSENASTKLDRLAANWTNLKVAIGNSANGTGALGKVTDELNTILEGLSKGDHLAWYEKLGAAATGPVGWMIGAKINLAKATEEEAKAQEKANAIHELATIYLKDLGLDFEALNNIEGSNTEIMAIWAEMQKIAADRVVVVTEETKKQGKAIEDLSDKYQILADVFPNIEELSNSITKMNQDLVSSMDLSFDIDEEAIDAKVEMLTSRLIGRMEEFRQATISANMIIEEGLENTVSGFASALGDLASGASGADALGAALLGGIGSVAIQLGQLAIGTGIAVQGIKKALQSLNPAVAIAGGIALIALGKIVSNKAAQMGRGGGGGGISSGGGGGGYAGAAYGSRMESVGQRIELSFTGDAGKVLKAQIIKQDRIDSRTRS